MWVKKFFGAEEQEEEIKTKEGLTRRSFLFMMPAVIVIPQMIKELPKMVAGVDPARGIDIIHITEVGQWPAGMHVRTTKPVELTQGKMFIFSSEHIIPSTSIDYEKKIMELYNADPTKYVRRPT